VFIVPDQKPNFQNFPSSVIFQNSFANPHLKKTYTDLFRKFRKGGPS